MIKINAINTVNSSMMIGNVSYSTRYIVPGISYNLSPSMNDAVHGNNLNS